MKNKEVYKKVNQAFSNLVPDVLDSVLSAYEKETRRIIVVTEKKKTNPWINRLSALAATFVIMISGFLGFNYYYHNFAVDSTVSFDVNPSIEIKVNRQERVLSTSALNKDAKIVISSMDFKGSSLEVTVNALIGSMLRNGYLNELANSILLSVENSDPVKGAELQRKLMRKINTLLESDHFNGAVLAQTVSTAGALQELADTHGITLGKAQLIRNIVERNKQYSFEDLVPLSINELNLLCGSQITGAGNVESTGRASDKAYIGTAAAKEIACKHAGHSASEVAALEVEMDWEQGGLVYEVEFKYGGYEYEYKIDAKTGTIRKIEKERLKEHPESSPVDNTQTPPPATSIGESKAKEIALTHAGLLKENITKYSIKRDYEHGSLIYEVEFKYGGYEYEYKIDAKTGTIRKVEKERLKEHPASSPVDNTQTPPSTTSIGESKAKEIALTHAGLLEGNITKYSIERDYEHGSLVYEVEFKYGGYEYEYKIDAETGAIRKFEKERD